MTTSATSDSSFGARQNGDKAGRRSLAREVLIKMAIRLAVVTAALTGLSYLHVLRSITQTSLDGLASYIKARGEREATIFRLAKDSHTFLASEFLDRYRALETQDLEAEFDSRYARSEDGLIRSRREGFDGRKHVGVAIGSDVSLDRELEQRVLAAHDTIEHSARIMQVRFLDTWFAPVRQSTVIHCPSQPDYIYSLEQRDFGSASAFFDVVDPAHDPSRKSVWTDSYIDTATGDVMVSLSTPLYDGDRFLGIVAHDILLQELIQRAMRDHLEGSYNLLLRRDGHLIAHPNLEKAITEAGGRFDITKAGDTKLQGIHRKVLSLEGEAGILESEDEKDYLAVAHIPGPDWYLVAVYPRALVEKTAFSTARLVLLVGLFALVFELSIVYLVLRRQIAAPLERFLHATRRVASGDLDVRLDEERSDELGAIATSFNSMALAVRDREEAQKEAEQAVRTLNEELSHNLERERERSEELLRLKQAVDELSTPVLEVWPDVLALPLIGEMDESRSQLMAEKLLDAVADTQCRFVILDITGVDSIDTATADRLLRVVRGVELLGAHCFLTGMRPSVAMALVSLGVNLGSLSTLRTLRHGLAACIREGEARR